MIVFGQYPVNLYNALLLDSSSCNLFAISFIGIAILILIYGAWIYSQKRKILNQELSISGVVESILFIVLYTVLVFISGFSESKFKFLFLFIIVANTIQYRAKVGMITAIINSIIILTIDILGEKSVDINAYFEADILLSGVFIVVAWMLGYYVKLEDQYRETAIQLANFDELTGVYNHRYFQNALSKHIEIADETQKNLCLLFIDIDHFKYYNDLYGHSSGDIVLSQVGALLKNSIREQDIVARYGGEEFVVIIPDISEEKAMNIGNRIRDMVETTHFEGEENQPSGKLTVSIGVSFYPDKSKSKQELINTADDALYRAKFFNKNRVESYYSILEELKSDIDSEQVDLVSSIKTLISVINAKDHYTYAHIDRVVIYCELMAKYLELSTQETKILCYGAYLHDVGKIQISKDVLCKKTSLTKEEWDILKSHPEKGLEIVQPVEALQEVWPLILHHHERYDGTGYPQGLKKGDIPYLVRIISIADSFDAMTSNRPYRNRKNYDEAIEELIKCSSTQFDPMLVQHFIKMLGENKDKLDIK
jgi:diguanylate cyclase (GGDEF)-like protein